MRYSKITSAANRHIKDAIQIREKRAKFRHAAFIIEGPHLIEMAMHAGIGIRDVFATESFMKKKEHQGLIKGLAKLTDRVYETTEHLLRKITDTEAPQGIAAVVSYKDLDLESLRLRDKAFVVVIDGIQDPGNLGTIIRTADAAGADAVVLLPGACDAFMPKAIRATAGSIFNLPIIYSGPAALLEWLRGERIPLAVTAATARQTIHEADLSGPVAMAFGNEAHGISTDLKQAADLSLKVPLFGKAESLNVATAAAICLYEIVRQRGK